MPSKKQEKPDPNNYESAKTDRERGFVENPVAGGLIPEDGLGYGPVNGVENEEPKTIDVSGTLDRDAE